MLDEAAEFWNGTPDEILDSVMQRYLATDDPETIIRADSLAKLKKLFGKNQGK